MPWREIIHDGEPQRNLLGKFKDWATRSFTISGVNLKDREVTRIFGSQPSSAGVSVDEHNATTYSAVWQAQTLISQHVATPPVPLYKRLPNGGKERAESHPQYQMVNVAPNPEMASFTFRQVLTGHVLLWGNGFAEIVRDGLGRAKELWPIMPWCVSTIRDGGVLRYRVRTQTGPDLIFDERDILHIKGCSDDGIMGVSVVQKARESFGLGLATERFGSTFFGNGATFGGIIKYPIGAGASPQARKDAREALERRHQGVDRAHRLLALYDGGEYQQIGVPPEDAQVLQTRRFQIEEIARWFNLPPHKLKHLDRSTYSNIEHQGIEYYTDTLLPWYRRWEGELNRKVINSFESGQFFFEFLVEGLLRGDSVGRSQYYKTMVETGIMSPDECRIRENLNPRGGAADTLRIPQQQPNGGMQ